MTVVQTRKATELNFQEVERHLRDNPNGLTPVELAEKCFYSRSTIWDYLRRLEAQGRVVRPRKKYGRWTLPGYPKDFQ